MRRDTVERGEAAPHCEVGGPGHRLVRWRAWAGLGRVCFSSRDRTPRRLRLAACFEVRDAIQTGGMG